MGRLLHAGVAVVLVALTAAAPAAGTERETAPPPGFTDLQFGRLLMEAGRLDDARVFLERARAAGEEEIERRFLLGQVEMRLGRPRHAARHFEAILAVRPELTRVRLELASAYYAAGRDEKARGHFEGALADRPPASVEAAVRGFLDRIDTRRRWTRSFSLALAPESNPLKRTDRDEVRIGGVPFRPDQTARSGTGLAVSAGLSFTPIIADDLRAVAAVSAAGEALPALGLERCQRRRGAGPRAAIRPGRPLRWPSPRTALARRRDLQPRHRPVAARASRTVRRHQPRPARRPRGRGLRGRTGRATAPGSACAPVCVMR